MKKNICIILLILIIFGTTIYISLLHKQLLNCNTHNTKKDENNEEIITNSDKEYDCSFTQTYRVVNLLDNYIAEVPELSYIILDKYLSHKAISHIIPTNMKSNLEIGKYYEFTYHIQGKGNIENIDDIYRQISSTEIYRQSDENTQKTTYKDKKMFVYLTIEETDKQGVEQINEDICK